nr:DUF6497 family protein [Roseibacterium persicicum]
MAFAPLTAAADAWPTGEVAAPSGQAVALDELLFEENPWSGELQVVVRLLAPAIADETMLYTVIRGDMDWACDTWGLPAAGTLASPPDWVVVEMMAAPAPRGEPTPDIRRLFETYRLEGPICIWELF